jgi:NAD(P)-dependent dehydrogenase (short-subunit alcohol dehydrogenase family)/acyl carrier protein
LASTGATPNTFATLDDLAATLDDDAPPPQTVWLDAHTDSPARRDSAHALPDRALDLAYDVLTTAQQWLADERFASARLVIVTQDAIAAREDDAVNDPAAATAWGLIRCAQSENPNRFVLIDLDHRDTSPAALGQAVATGEPQLAIRDGNLLTPRLARTTAPPAEPLTNSQPSANGTEATALNAPVALDPARSVLITGGTGVVGAHIARHLVSEHGVRSLLLTSRRGPQAPDASALAAELEQLGARVSIIACDVSDRSSVKRLLADVPPDMPLGTVIHAAGALHDGVIATLDREHLTSVFSPKVNAAWHLHELTQDADLQAFVLCSSVAGTLGSPAQGNYAAANAFLDSLAAHRRANRLPATSIAWGLWAPTSELTGSISDTYRARIQRSGIAALEPEQALQLFDLSRARSDTLLLPMRLNTAALSRQAKGGSLPPLLRGLIRAPTARADSASLTRRLAATPHAEHASIILELVRAEAASVLGHSSPRAIDPEATFKDLGVDSLTAVELRNRLNTATGLNLAGSLVFDYPTPAQAAAHILEKTAAISPHAVLDADLTRLHATLSAQPPDEAQRARIAIRLQAMLGELGATPISESDLDAAEGIGSASKQELFALIDEELPPA